MTHVKGLLAASAGLFAALIAIPASAQTPRGDFGVEAPARGNTRDASADGPPPRALDRSYAFSGNWRTISSWKTGPVPRRGEVPFTPAYELKRAALERDDKSGQIIPGRNNRCIPAGMPDMLTFGFTVFADAEKLVMLGGYGTIRTISLVQKEHTARNKLFPTYQGEAIAHWEGETLVIDSVGFDPSNEITYALPVDDDAMHIVERWRLRDRNTLEDRVTIISAKALTKPWDYTMVYGRRANDQVHIDYCDDPLVNGVMNLTPPAGGFIPPGASE